MNWEIVNDPDELSRAAAAHLLSTVERRADAVLGLPTGRTPEGMYAAVVAGCRAKYRCFLDVRTFNLDEYVGIGPTHPGSYRAYMQRHLFGHVDIRPENIHIPDGLAASARADMPGLDFESALHLECARYEAAIAANPIDLIVLGVGRNGHIGFNEPGASFDSRTRVVQLTESTRRANAPCFPDGNVPDRAITMGIATILSAKTIVLLASGESKRDAMSRLHAASPDPSFPASALAGHPDVTVIVDRAAAPA